MCNGGSQYDAYETKDNRYATENEILFERIFFNKLIHFGPQNTQ